jgi:hypothetical protein
MSEVKVALKNPTVKEMKNKVGLWSHDIGLGRPTFTSGGRVYLSNGTKLTLHSAYQLAEAYFYVDIRPQVGQWTWIEDKASCRGEYGELRAYYRCLCGKEKDQIVSRMNRGLTSMCRDCSLKESKRKNPITLPGSQPWLKK